jgi:hypothetical protein
MDALASHSAFFAKVRKGKLIVLEGSPNVKQCRIVQDVLLLASDQAAWRQLSEDKLFANIIPTRQLTISLDVKT